jgi:hypothetical protein
MVGSEMAEPLDDYIDAVAKALALPVEERGGPRCAPISKCR